MKRMYFVNAGINYSHRKLFCKRFSKLKDAKICFLEMCKMYNFCSLERFDADSYYLENQKVIYQQVKK